MYVLYITDIANEFNELITICSENIVHYRNIIFCDTRIIVFVSLFRTPDHNAIIAVVLLLTQRTYQFNWMTKYAKQSAIMH